MRRALLAAMAAFVGLTTPARADLQFCNKTSYVLDLALGLEEKGAAATRGWFRVEPGQCKSVMQGTPEAEKVYVHTRAHPAYGPSPLPQAGHADFCVGQGNFTLPATQGCHRSGQKMADVPVAPATAGGTHQIDLPLGAMAAGEYVIEITAKRDGTEVKELVPLRIGS